VVIRARAMLGPIDALSSRFRNIPTSPITVPNIPRPGTRVAHILTSLILNECLPCIWLSSNSIRSRIIVWSVPSTTRRKPFFINSSSRSSSSSSSASKPSRRAFSENAIIFWIILAVSNTGCLKVSPIAAKTPKLSVKAKAIIRAKYEPTRTRRSEGISIKAPRLLPLNMIDPITIAIAPNTPTKVPMFMPLFIFSLLDNIRT